MFCEQCGNKMSDSAKFCTKCGWKAPEKTNAETTGSNTSDAPEVKAQEPVVADKPKKKSKLWLWILIIVLVLGLGATATVLYLKYVESAEEDEDEEDEDRDEDDSEDEGGLAGSYDKYVEKSEITATVQMIWSTMDVLEILAVDPEMDWEIGEVVYVKFTEDGLECGSDNEEIISQLNAIMGDNTAVKQWLGFEMWAKKNETGWVEFATSWDYDDMAEINPSFADGFDMTSVEP